MTFDPEKMVNEHSIDHQTVKTCSAIDSFENDDRVVLSSVSYIQKSSMNEDANLLLSTPWQSFNQIYAINGGKERNGTDIKLLPRRSKHHKAISIFQNDFLLYKDTHFSPINLSDGSTNNPVSNFVPSNDNHSSPIFFHDEKKLENMDHNTFLTPKYRHIENALFCPQVAARSNKDVIQLPFCIESKLLLPMFD
mmetsp:Transcript_39468/g.43650  ORF Transcript_39468/g.43650 Transcript_39468/m.43650 type:complete len:194 (-) Transcript_39468:130-711(-)|eukprot:CAMPEP_0194130046 /NCGR_PEP_ID=MMETSP0152-20130528/1209_1 /TAXON_ID=1049557 /ORGANISM="Thalassiothrix antarctica, Strain L6-D1" /LENGTH=193 /DNA_ID=CAMNT_0038824463 /DNA_START=201 /DNA_END=782 /DNA_ORIENTATION=-